jgi:2-polyprenyl-6-methoxyphenol hydroxylase-like FAD-dependent oxidoreductase
MSTGARHDSVLGHAVVLGGSAAGLFAARVLADHAAQVTLVERDELSDSVVHRKGTPQSHHANNVLPRAVVLLERWFPGITDELARAGASEVSDAARPVVRGVRFARTHGAPKTLLMTRPLLDAVLRRRLRALPNVSWSTRHEVTGLSANTAGIAGVRLRSDAGESVLASELVVDAMGRGTRARRWLRDLGYPAPPVTEVRMDVRYASRLFSRSPADLDGDQFVLLTPTAQVPRGAVAFAVEGQRWLVTLFAYGHAAPPVDIEGFIAFARSLVVPDLASLLERAAPLDAGAPFSYPSACLQRFDRAKARPEGYVCIGDALCSLNPCYGSGITSAALQADALCSVLKRGPAGLPRRYYAAAVRAAARPFELTWSADLDIPGVVAPPNPTPAPVRAYLRRAMSAAGHDAQVAVAIRRIIGLIDPPYALLRPAIAQRVLLGSRRRAEP